MKAVISAGGRGRRMHTLTQGETPKSLLHAGGKPVIAYQLEQMASAGVNEVLLTITNEKFAPAFSRAVKTRYFPEMHYEISTYPGNSPIHAFADPVVRAYVAGGDFFWCYADMVTESVVFPTLLDRHSEEKANYATRHFSPRGRNESAGVRVNCKNLVDNSTGLRAELHPPFLILGETAGILGEEAANRTPKTGRLLRRVCDESVLYGVGPFHVINVNTPQDLYALETTLYSDPQTFRALVPAH